MYRYNEIRHVHLEASTRCNAACPMCARNVRGATAQGLALTDIPLASVQAILTGDLLEELEGLELCGSYGDPAMCRDLLDILGFVRSHTQRCQITLYTNGGIRTTEWWRRCAEVLGTRGLVVFAIDGLRETNAVYRRGVVFDKVLANARAFIGAGGAARWEFLAFRHNEHEIEEARALSEEMGFREFAAKRTGRFMDALFDYIPEAEGREDLSVFPIYSRDGVEVGGLRPTSDSRWTKEAASEYGALFGPHGRLGHVLLDTPIQCRAAHKRSVFIGAEGHAFPCPWTYVHATRPALGGFPQTANWEVHALLEACGGLDAVDAVRHGLQAVVEGAFFAAVEQRWSGPGRLQICARTCGTDVAEALRALGDHKAPLVRVVGRS